METKEIITIDDFVKLDIRLGLVEQAVIVEQSEKLIKMTVRFGEGEDMVRTIFAGIKLWYTPEDLIGKKLAFIVNLEPRKMMGEESQGMMLAAGAERAWLWPIADEVPLGAVIR